MCIAHQKSYALEAYGPPDDTPECAGFVALSDSDRARLDTQRSIVMAVLSETYGVTTLRKDRADLPLLQRMLDDGVFSVEQTIELQSMGIVFGDVLVKELGLQWRMISDEYGTDPTVTIPEISDGVVCFNTLTMISKRIEEGREVDVNRLFEVVEAEVKRSRSEGEDKDKRESLSRS